MAMVRHPLFFAIGPRHDDADAKRDADGSQHTSNPEALHATAIMGQVPVTKRRAKVVWRVVPRSATRYAPGTIARCSHAPVAGIAGVRFVPAILCPVPYVAMDIVDAPSIRPEAVHPHRRLPPLASVSLLIGQAVVVGSLGGNRGTPPEWCGGSGACRVFAFRLGREAIKFSGLFGQPGAVSLSGLEIDTRHRMVIVLNKTWRSPGPV